MDASHIASKYVPFFEHFAHSPIVHGSEIIGHDVLLISNGKTLGGGTAESKSSATQIALAEALERTTVTLSADRDLKDILFDQYPTSCGFAAGFDQKSTKMRSICEATERWCWEQWIDNGYLNPIVEAKSLSKICQYSLSFFDDVLFYQNKILVFAGEISFTLKFNVVLGIKGEGVFPGSRVTTETDDGWEHASIEALRHLKIFENELSKSSALDFIDARIKFFGRNRGLALNNINSCKKIAWPPANLLFSKKLSTPAEYFVYRSICKNFKGWHVGNESRFIY